MPYRLILLLAALFLPVAFCSYQPESPPPDPPTMRVSCEVLQDPLPRVLNGTAGYVRAGALLRFEVLAVDEADARRQFEAAGVGTRQKPCLRIGRERV